MEPRHWVLGAIMLVLLLAGTRVGADMLLAVKDMLRKK